MFQSILHEVIWIEFLSFQQILLACGNKSSFTSRISGNPKTNCSYLLLRGKSLSPNWLFLNGHNSVHGFYFELIFSHFYIIILFFETVKYGIVNMKWCLGTWCFLKLTCCNKIYATMNCKPSPTSYFAPFNHHTCTIEL